MNAVMSLKGRDFLTLLDFSTEEILDLLALAADLKAKQKAGVSYTPLSGKTMAMIFEKPQRARACRLKSA
ncbi:Ornithine carbamoyltransferase [Geobacillus sp. WSUCF1]|nr:Ornithine carbamoyltransferase [Geobacillus sp. WSUCF1]